MTKNILRTIGKYIAIITAEYLTAEILIYLIFPFWKWSSVPLLLGLTSLMAFLAVIPAKKFYLQHSIFLSFLLMLPIFIGMLAKSPIPVSVQYKTIGFSLACSGSIFALQSFIPFRKIRKLFLVFVYSFILFLYLIFWGYYFSSGTLLGATAILAIFQTNLSEAKSYLVDYMPWQGWLAASFLSFLFAAISRYSIRRLPVRGGGINVF